MAQGAFVVVDWRKTTKTKQEGTPKREAPKLRFQRFVEAKMLGVGNFGRRQQSRGQDVARRSEDGTTSPAACESTIVPNLSIERGTGCPKPTRSVAESTRRTNQVGAELRSCWHFRGEETRGLARSRRVVEIAARGGGCSTFPGRKSRFDESVNSHDSHCNDTKRRCRNPVPMKGVVVEVLICLERVARSPYWRSSHHGLTKWFEVLTQRAFCQAQMCLVKTSNQLMRWSAMLKRRSRLQLGTSGIAGSILGSRTVERAGDFQATAVCDEKYRTVSERFGEECNASCSGRGRHRVICAKGVGGSCP